ncbi:MAG: hypothetical protein ABIH77_06225 [Pseudomonadota bacterium]|nr:hypothetical protein [Gammaproteobacteria bacterium]MBU1927183.1 hypothetical protein [Gammaproteobacteria bacterium]MBU2546386.1 hypothetical protein [Gammaproteobacteria bacterium]
MGIKSRALRRILKTLLGPFGTVGMIHAREMIPLILKKINVEDNEGINLSGNDAQIPIKTYNVTGIENKKNKYQQILEKHYILTSPAKDNPDAFKGIGTNYLEDLLNVLSIEKDTTYLIPFAQVLEKRNHWTLLIIDVNSEGNKKATLIDPKYATPGGRNLSIMSRIDRSQYPYEKTLEMLEKYGINELTVRFTGKQSFFNRWKCGPKVKTFVLAKLKGKNEKRTVQEITISKDEKEISRTSLKRKKVSL